MFDVTLFVKLSHEFTNRELQSLLFRPTTNDDPCFSRPFDDNKIVVASFLASFQCLAFNARLF